MTPLKYEMTRFIFIGFIALYYLIIPVLESGTFSTGALTMILLILVMSEHRISHRWVSVVN
ncbi:hypothetical protein ACTWQB_16845, partial [Piscibacillus sp. B03]